jgi:hypothetical protein
LQPFSRFSRRLVPVEAVFDFHTGKFETKISGGKSNIFSVLLACDKLGRRSQPWMKFAPSHFVRDNYRFHFSSLDYIEDAMNLTDYFSKLIARVEESDTVTNAATDDNGFYKPKKTILLRHLNLLRDLHAKPLARPMLKGAWAAVVKELPPEWLVLDDEQKAELRKILE